jgi:hypothetical protein
MREEAYLGSMEPLLETVELDSEASNELFWRVKIEGAATSPAKVRLVCEGKDNMAYMFHGVPTQDTDIISFTLPPLHKALGEGTYKARLEVLVENRYFAPVEFEVCFKKVVSVVAEAVKVQPRHKEPDVKVTASPVVKRGSVIETLASLHNKRSKK